MSRSLVTRTVGVVLLVISLAVLANEELKPRMFPKRFGIVVEDALYRSGRIHPDILPGILREHQIDTVISLTHEKAGHEWQEKEKAIVKAHGLRLLRFPLDGDGTGNPDSYVNALRAIDTEIRDGRRVLVHCAAGTQRTGGAVFLYRTLYQDWSAEAAVAEMRQYNFDPTDNPDLLPYLAEHLATISTGIRGG